MRRLATAIDVRSEEFRLNSAHNRTLAGEHKARQDAARRTRPARDIERLKRQGMMFVRDRIELAYRTDGEGSLAVRTAFSALPKERRPLRSARARRR